MELHDIQHHHILYRISDILSYNSKKPYEYFHPLINFQIFTCTTANIFENDVLIIIKKINESKFCTAV